MEEEIFITGYCRALDQSRTVTAEWFDGRWSADCAYPDCPHAAACPLAERLAALEAGEDLP